MKGFRAAVEARILAEREVLLATVRDVRDGRTREFSTREMLESRAAASRERVQRGADMRERAASWVEIHGVLETPTSRQPSFERAVYRELVRRRVNEVRRERS